MPTEDWRAANAPLFDEGLIDVVEWSVDFGWSALAVPDWVPPLLDTFEAKGALLAHGVELSLMSAEWTDEQEAWLAELAAETKRRRYAHFTEHYGFITAADFVRGTPLPLPPSRTLLELSRGRIARLRDVTGLDVGLENLAFAFGAHDALAQADFLSALCEATGAFLLFDVHNVVCQAHNFGLDALALSRRYPLERVRELHVAGGSLAAPTQHDAARSFRRDTHDDLMPGSVLALLEQLLPRCPALEHVILERTDRSLFGAAEREAHQREVRALKALVARGAATNIESVTKKSESMDASKPTTTLGPRVGLIADGATDLLRTQGALLQVLSREEDPAAALAALGAAVATPHRPYVTAIELRALEIATRMVRQWSARAPASDAAPTMPAAVLRRAGAPLESWNLPIPVPGPGQVRLAVQAVGLCGTDALAYEGRFPLPLPIVLGHETVGLIDAIGEGVHGLAIGDRVGVPWVQRGCGACPGCARGAIHRCEAPRTWVVNGGGLSAHCIVEASGCFAIPDGLPSELAAPLLCAGFTVMSGLLKAQPQPGERVAVLGLGGLGHLAVQISKARGHEVVAITRSADKERDARTLGADHAIVASGPTIGAALDACGGCDVLIATTPSSADVEGAIAGLRVGGRLVLAGLSEPALTLDPSDLVMRELALFGAVQGPREDLKQLLGLAASGAVTPWIEPFPIELAQRALERLIAGRTRYRAVVTLRTG